MGNIALDSLVAAAGLAAVEVNKADGERLYNMGRLGNLYRRVHDKVSHTIQVDKEYDWSEICKLINDADILKMFMKKAPDRGVYVINDEDIVSIMEAMRWSITCLQSGIAMDVVPAFVTTKDNAAAGYSDNIWNCVIVAGTYKEGDSYMPYAVLSGKSEDLPVFTHIGNTAIKFKKEAGEIV